MADDKVQVTVSAEVGQFRSEIGLAAQALQELTARVREVSAALPAAAAPVQSITASLPNVSAAATGASKSVSGLSRAVTEASQSARQFVGGGYGSLGETVKKSVPSIHQATDALQGFAIHSTRAKTELIVLAHELAMGNYTRFTGSLMVLAEAMGGIPLSAMAAAGAIGILAVALYHAVSSAHEAAEALRVYRDVQAAAGQGTRDLALLEVHIGQVAAAAGTSSTTAAQFATSLSRIPGISAAALGQLERLTPVVARLNGITEDEGLAKFAADMARSFSSPPGLARLNDDLRVFVGAEKDAFETMAKMDFAEAQERLVRGMNAKYHGGANDAYSRSTQQSGLSKFWWGDFNRRPDGVSQPSVALTTDDSGYQKAKALAADEVEQTRSVIAALKSEVGGDTAEMQAMYARMWQKVVDDTKGQGAAVDAAAREANVAQAAATSAAANERVALQKLTLARSLESVKSGSVEEARLTIASLEAEIAARRQAGQQTITLETQLWQSRRTLLQAEQAEQKESATAKLRQLEEEAQVARQGSSQRVALAVSANQFAMEQFHGESAEYKRTLTQMMAASREYDREQRAIATARAAGERQLGVARLQEQRERLDAEVEAGDLSAQQKIAKLRQVEAEQFALDSAAAAEATAAADKDGAAYVEAKNRELLVAQQYHAKLATLDRQSAAAHAASVREWVAPFNQAISGMVQGMFQGTLTLQQLGRRAVTNIAASYAAKGAEMAADWVLKHTVMAAAEKLFAGTSIGTFFGMEAAKTTATTTGTATRAGVTATGEATQTTVVVAGEATRVAAQTTGAAAGLAAKATAAGSSILMDAYTAMAGAYAAISAIPYVGPFLAPAIAAGMFAAVIGLASKVSSAEGGWGEVPYDGAPAILHKKEMVLPASLAVPLRALLTGSQQVPAVVGDRQSAAPAPAVSQGDIHLHLGGVSVSVAGGGSLSQSDIHSAAVQGVLHALQTGQGALVRAIRKAQVRS